MESHEVLFLMVLALVVGYPLILFLCSFVFASKSCETSTKDDKHLISVCKDEGTLNLIRKRSKQRKRKKSFTSASTSALERQPKVSLSQPHKHISIRRINTPRGIRTVVVEKKMPSFPCHRCKERTAKKGCSYRFCASCCRNFTNSVCGVHGTGFQASQERVLQACKEQAYELDLSFSHLSRYPKGIPDVGEQLELLNLSTNHLPSLPEGIGALVGIRECYLQYNCLTRVPESMCRLVNLQELDIKNNRLTSLPKDIGKCRFLRILALSNNNLKELPSTIGQLSLLEELNLHQNELVSLPEEICQLKNLKCLYLGKNQLKSLPNNFGKLDDLLELDLSDCQLTTLPDSICHCQSLDKLWVNNNRLRSLPNRIGDLSRLREFHVRSNQLQCLPATMLNMSLYTFTAHDNCFLHEFDQRKIARYFVSPSCRVPTLQESTGRAIADFGVSWKKGLIPNHLEEYLQQLSHCTRCGGPFFGHFWGKLTFGVVVVTRVPLLHEECSLYCKEYDADWDSLDSDPSMLW